MWVQIEPILTIADMCKEALESVGGMKGEKGSTPRKTCNACFVHHNTSRPGQNRTQETWMQDHRTSDVTRCRRKENVLNRISFDIFNEYTIFRPTFCAQLSVYLPDSFMPFSRFKP